MSLFGKPKGEKYHARIIDVSTSEYDEERLVVEGCLTDNRLQEYYLVTGEKKSPGILHQMIIHLLVKKATLEIEDIRVEMPCAPNAECPTTIHSLEKVKGLRIAGGFTSKVKAMTGHGKGCNHLVALLTAMGASAVQGYAAYNMHGSAGFSSDMLNIIDDTCWVWRTKGPLIASLKEKHKTRIRQ